MRDFEVNENPAWIRQEPEPEPSGTRKVLLALGIVFLTAVTINKFVLGKYERIPPS